MVDAPTPNAKGARRNPRFGYPEHISRPPHPRGRPWNSWVGCHPRPVTVAAGPGYPGEGGASVKPTATRIPFKQRGPRRDGVNLPPKRTSEGRQDSAIRETRLPSSPNWYPSKKKTISKSRLNDQRASAPLKCRGFGRNDRFTGKQSPRRPAAQRARWFCPTQEIPHTWRRRARQGEGILKQDTISPTPSVARARNATTTIRISEAPAGRGSGRQIDGPPPFPDERETASWISEHINPIETRNTNKAGRAAAEKRQVQVSYTI